MSGNSKLETQNSKLSCLFLDRDGVINTRTPGDYVQRRREFVFEKEALEALQILAGIFPKIVVVTNQQGIGKGLMTAAQLADVHQFMLEQVAAAGGRIDGVYHCPHLAASCCGCRKPAVGMGLQAQADFPEIDFSKSWLVGDSASDMVFGKTLGMRTVLVAGKMEEAEALAGLEVDFRVKSLADVPALFSPNR